MAKDAVATIARLLVHEDSDKRVAAAIVLAEIGAKGREVVRGLGAMLGSDDSRVRAAAIDAVATLGVAGSLVDELLPRLGARAPEERDRVVHLLAKVGDRIVRTVEARREHAGAEERKAIDAVLAQLGGREAFDTLLSAIGSADEEEAQAAARSMRAHADGADARARSGYLQRLERYLEQTRKAKEPSATALRAALKMLGYLEDPRSVPTLLKFAKDRKLPGLVRQEGLIALRFAAVKPDAALVAALVEAAEDADRTLARTALMTLAAIGELPAKAAARLAALVAHPDPERAGFVIEMLGHRDDPGTTKALLEVVARGDLARAEQAARILEPRDGSGALLADVLLEVDDTARARIVGRSVRARAGDLSPARTKTLLAHATEAVVQGSAGWEPLADTALGLAERAFVEGLRERAKRSRDEVAKERILRVVRRSGSTSEADRYALASLALRNSAKDPRPPARARDEALRLLTGLANEGFDLASALSKDKSVDLDALYYVGFHFAEERHPLGEELLEIVAEQGGRKKIGQMAKNKLGLARR